MPVIRSGRAAASAAPIVVLLVVLAFAATTAGAQPLIGPVLPALGSHEPVANANGSTEHPTRLSSNWSGYVDESTSRFQQVEATFVQPAVNCHRPLQEAPTSAAFWVGFDGWSNDEVEQVGTDASCDRSTERGQEREVIPTYIAWWEMYPTVDLIELSQTIRPGDLIQLRVKYVPHRNVYVMTVNDKTQHKKYSETQPCGINQVCSRNSADWIVERPSAVTERGVVLSALAEFGLVKFTSASAHVEHGRGRLDLGALPGAQLEMDELAASGPLSAGGTAFTDTWRAE